MVSLMTALWFSELRAEDRVSVKPHASPVLHAINYLLGRLERPYLESLRAFGGLQSYPSRTKDPDPVDYSTGSVGIGATAPIWAAIARRYLEHHRFEAPPRGREIALLGDAELDEGAVWEAIADPWVARLGEVLWVVDLNRQSLDRVVPDIAFGRLAGMFEAAGWQVLTVKYGRRLETLFERAGGEDLRRRIDEMPNEEYQRLLRAGAGELRERLPGRSAGLATLVGDLPDDELRRAFRDLGGHDIGKLIEAYRAVQHDRPTVIFAYTIKGWSLPIEGHPENHSALLTRRPVRGAVEAARRRRGGSVGALRPGQPRGRARRGSRNRARARGAGAAPAAGGAAGARPQAPRPGVDAAGVRALLRGPRARGAGGRRARGDREPRRRELHEPRRLDQQVRDLVRGRAARLVRGRPADARPLARDDGRPPHRARHRGDEPGRPAGRAGRHLEPPRAAAPPDRHDLRPVRRPRARALVVRDLRRRPVDPDRHAVGRLARARGRRAPVDRHAVDRDRPAGLHVLGAGLRAGPRVDAAEGAVAAGPRGRRVRLLPALHAADRPVAGRRRRLGRAPRPRAGRRLSAAACEGAAGGDARGNGRRDAGGAPGRRRARRRRRRDLRHQRRPAPPRPARPGRLRRAPAGDPRGAVPARASCADGHRARRRPGGARLPRRRWRQCRSRRWA